MVNMFNHLEASHQIKCALLQAVAQVRAKIKLDVGVAMRCAGPLNRLTGDVQTYNSLRMARQHGRAIASPTSKIQCFRIFGKLSSQAVTREVLVFG